MISAAQGRFQVYHHGIEAQPDSDPLRVALDNNLFGTLETPAPAAWLEAMVDYLLRSAESLAQIPTPRLMAGELFFPMPLPSPSLDPPR
jgi:hypothetical protein